jgi:AcrR family transcriptional regulator
MGGVARTYTKVARAAAQDRTRTALVDAAERAFFTGPWGQASLEAIAADAGVTKQTLLRHFGSKDALLEQAYARAFDAVREQRMSAPPDDVDAAIDNLLDHYEEHGERGMKLGALPSTGRMAEFGERARQMHYDWVDHAFGAHIGATRGVARARLRAALIVACDIRSWWILAHDLELGRREVRATLILTVRRLLEEDT